MHVTIQTFVFIIKEGEIALPILPLAIQMSFIPSILAYVWIGQETTNLFSNNQRCRNSIHSFGVVLGDISLWEIYDMSNIKRTFGHF